MPLDFHFLNIGHGDCTFIDFPSGRLTMVDISNSKNLPTQDEIALAAHEGIALETFKSRLGATWYGNKSERYYRSLLVDPFDYYAGHFAGRSIFRYIQTHPDMDHMSGLYRFFWQEDVDLVNFWDTQHNKELDEDDFDHSRYEWADWLVYQLMRHGRVQEGDEHKVLHNLQGEAGSYWTEDGISVLAPTAELLRYCNQKEEWNNSSYVVKVSFAGRSVILPGDAEKVEWEYLRETVGDTSLSCDILKAAHHGRESGFHKPAVSAMSPDIVLCSVGKKPETDASDEYEALGASVLSTRYHGPIRVRIWENGAVEVTDHKGDRIHGLPRHR